MYWEGIEREEDTFHSLLFLLFFLFLHPRKLHLLIREILSLFCQEERNKLTVCLWKSAFHFSFLIIFIEFIFFFKKTIPWTVTPSIETWYTEKKREMKSCIQSDKNHHHPRSSSGAFLLLQQQVVVVVSMTSPLPVMMTARSSFPSDGKFIHSRKEDLSFIRESHPLNSLSQSLTFVKRKDS